MGLAITVLFVLALWTTGVGWSNATEIGREVAIPRHLQDGEEYEIATRQLIDFGKKTRYSHHAERVGHEQHFIQSPVSRFERRPAQRPTEDCKIQ